MTLRGDLPSGGRASGTPRARASARAATSPRATTSARATGSPRARASTVAGASGLGALLTDPSILKVIRGADRLKPGDVPKNGVTLKAAEATRLLGGIIRFVADVPAGSSPIVVWEQDGSELWVDISTVALTCIPGVIRVAVKVGCDQLPAPAVITVPFGVGTPEAPTGLVMSSLSRLDGPDVVTGRWTAALTAFTWEAILELARRMCAELGKDAAGLPLIPGSIAAGSQVLVVQPMARNDLSGLRR
ncbi:hypothetical protein BJ986_002307 [Phycicoccus badiiscoriae]|uniref:Uncharacterized protein n=1 Tax=Pedococcus badiiscoriae TaxID=642776 RepID=A0A852WGA2_9MICO|nr:hypothetical protein [Pedococcus badiiscoriae]NYG07820.1 hypothetical protein [Pedococcus badiiscoriae]